MLARSSSADRRVHCATRRFFLLRRSHHAFDFFYLFGSVNLVKEDEPMLTDGFYTDVTLEYDTVIAQENNGRPLG